MSKESLSEGSALTTLEELGAMQWGLITTAQAQQAGIERIWLSRLLQRGVIHRIRHGVYALPSATHGSSQELHAAWLTTDRARTLEERVLGDNDVVVSHISASNVHELGDLIATAHEFSSSRRRQTAQQDVLFYRRKLISEDIVLKDGLPVTSIPRTIADLADLHVDFDHLAQVVKDALSKSAADFQTLASRLSPSARAYGYGDGSDFMDALIDEAGLPVTAESLLARNLSSALSPGLTQVLKEFDSPQYLENLREGLKAALPILDAAQEISEMYSKLVQPQLPNIDLAPWAEQLDFSSWTKNLPSGLKTLREIDSSQSTRINKPEQSATGKESEQRAAEDHESDES